MHDHETPIDGDDIQSVAAAGERTPGSHRRRHRPAPGGVQPPRDRTQMMSGKPARRSHMVVAAALTVALAVGLVGAPAWYGHGSSATVVRPAGSDEEVAPAGARTTRLPPPPGPAAAPADAEPPRVYADWQINEMTARHPEP